MEPLGSRSCRRWNRLSNSGYPSPTGRAVIVRRVGTIRTIQNCHTTTYGQYTSWPTWRLRETLQMPIDRPPDFQRCSKSPHEIMPINSRASDKHLCRTRLGLCGDTTELKKPPTLLPATERLRLSRREAMRCASSWLHGLIVAAALIATTPAAWSGDIRVGFINPTGPARILASRLCDDAGRGSGTRDQG